MRECPADRFDGLEWHDDVGEGVADAKAAAVAVEDISIPVSWDAERRDGGGCGPYTPGDELSAD